MGMWVEIMEISSEHSSEGVIIIIAAANNNDKAGGVCKRIAFELGGCQRIGTEAPLGRIFVCAVGCVGRAVAASAGRVRPPRDAGTAAAELCRWDRPASGGGEHLGAL